MPTEEDLRATLSALEYEAPDPADTLAGLNQLRRRRTSRRRTGVMVAVAGVTLALAAGSLAAPDLFFQPAAPPEHVDGPWNFRFAVDPIPGTQVKYISIGEDEDWAGVHTGGLRDPSFGIRVFHPGKYDPTEARAGTSVDVAGKPGFYRDDMPCLCNSIVPIPGVVWEYAPNAWAYVNFHHNGSDPRPADVRAQLLLVASAVRTDRTTPLRVPFRIGYLPAGVRAHAGGTSSAGMTDARTGVSKTSLTVFAKLAAVDQGGPGLGISLEPGWSPSAPVDKPIGEPEGTMDAAGSRAYVNLGPFKLTLWSGEGGPWLPLEELMRIARSITVAGDYEDPSTWITANEGIPIS